MGASNIIVRAAAKQDIAGIAAVFARAFEDDPPFAWMLPDATSRRRRLEAFFVTTLRWETLRHGGVEVACSGERIVGAAMWLPPERWRLSLGRQLLALPGLLRAFGRRIGRGTALVNVTMRAHPTQPHWYLYGIGVDPDAQGRGVGSVLLRSGLDRCDAAGLPAFLESSKPDNVPLYEHFGFVVSGKLGLPADAPAITPMWRSPGRRDESA
jgi:GNAT superfamily N-acetyltransferase